MAAWQLHVLVAWPGKGQQRAVEQAGRLRAAAAAACPSQATIPSTSAVPQVQALGAMAR